MTQKLVLETVAEMINNNNTMIVCDNFYKAYKTKCESLNIKPLSKIAAGKVIKSISKRKVSTVYDFGDTLSNISKNNSVSIAKPKQQEQLKWIDDFDSVEPVKQKTVKVSNVKQSQNIKKVDTLSNVKQNPIVSNIENIKFDGSPQDIEYEPSDVNAELKKAGLCPPPDYKGENILDRDFNFDAELDKLIEARAKRNKLDDNSRKVIDFF